MTDIATRSGASLQASTKRSLTLQLEEASAHLRTRILLDQWRLPWMYEAGKSPSKEEKTAVMATISGIRSGLSREVGSNDLRAAISLLVGGLKVTGGLEPKSVAAAYAMALEDAKASVLTLAVRNLLTGKAPDRFSKTFLPSAAELATYCAELEAHLVLLADTTERLLNLPEAKPARPEPSLAEREAMQKQIKDLMRPLPKAPEDGK